MLGTMLPAQQKVTLSIDESAQGIAIPPDFMGLSFESAAILPDENGHYPYFRANNQPLIRLFRTLDIKSLRIGGNTADRPSVKIPSSADIDSVYAFAREAGAKVIYTVRLRDSKPGDVISTAKYVVEHYAAETHCINIGNEPNIYEKQYPVYRDRLKQFMVAISAAAPGARFCGPATTPGPDATWAADFAADFGPSGKIVEITQHSYPGGNSRAVTNPAAAREKILSPGFARQYRELYDAFVPAVHKQGLGYRIEETNSFYNGGAKDVSNTQAAALWSLDYLYWWAAHNARGVNFHTGDNVAAGEQQTPCWYATFWTAPAGYHPHALAYGIKAFDLGSHGALIPVHLTGAAPNLSAYAVRGSDALYVTLINKDKANSIAVGLKASQLRGTPAAMFLVAPNSDLGAIEDITLGGSSISNQGTWGGKWSALKAGKTGVAVNLAPASAVVVKLPLK
jgi:hypothetical protein